VHAHGLAQPIEDRERLLGIVRDLTQAHEAGRAHPWAVEDAPADFTSHLLEAIVGVEIPLDRLVGKWKMSQNRPEADRLGVAAGLAEDGPDDPQVRAHASLVRAGPRPR
jgi:transcriptional regulator